MTDLAYCTHQRTQLIAKDDDAEYLECLDCGAIFDPRELSASPPTPAPTASGPGASETVKGDSGNPEAPGESLSDA